jgi:hypothetical protein
MSFNDLQGLGEALKLRGALFQANNYLVTPNEEVKLNKPLVKDLQLPLVTPGGRIFARKAIKQSQTLVVKSELKPGTIIEYKLRPKVFQYGEVMGLGMNEEKVDSVIVNPISAIKANELIQSNPEVQKMSLSEKDTEPSSLFKSVIKSIWIVDYFLDPLDRLVFKLLIGLLGQFSGIVVADKIWVRELILGLVMALASVICVYYLASR